MGTIVLLPFILAIDTSPQIPDDRSLNTVYPPKRIRSGRLCPGPAGKPPPDMARLFLDMADSVSVCCDLPPDGHLSCISVSTTTTTTTQQGIAVVASASTSTCPSLRGSTAPHVHGQLLSSATIQAAHAYENNEEGKNNEDDDHKQQGGGIGHVHHRDPMQSVLSEFHVELIKSLPDSEIQRMIVARELQESFYVVDLGKVYLHI